VDQIQDLGRQLGAQWSNCSVHSEDARAVTHVIAVSEDSPEASWGLQNERFVVKPAWLLCCAITWYHVRESDFVV
jgi:hypothetical protein